MQSIRPWVGDVGKYIFLIGTMLCARTAHAQTAPGTQISNRADVVYSVEGEVRRATSNTVTFAVAERLDVSVSGDQSTPTPITRAPSTVTATVTNMGSGAETLDITVQPSAGVRVEQVAIDTNGDGRFDAGVDQPLTGETPVLAAGEALHLIAVVASVDVPVDGTLTIAASAHTGSGEANRSFPGQGDDGVDAVVGRTGAAASVALPLVARTAAPTLTKQQAVRAPDGSSRAVSGAIVTYTLIAAFPGGSARDARLEDPVPEGTSYVAGSLRLDGVPLSDAADADDGDCDGRTVAVALGTPAVAVARAVTFQVRLP